MRTDPLVVYLLILTFSTGLIDALSVLSLGHVFTANMTGNVVFVGFALSGWHEFPLALCLLSAAGFFCGSLLGGRLSFGLVEPFQSTVLDRGAKAELLLQLPALLIMVLPSSMLDLSKSQAVLLILLGASMGVRNAIARKLAVPDLTTTVLTLTVTGIMADSRLAGGSNPRLARRVLAIAAMCSGAMLGGYLIRNGYQLLLILASIVVCYAASRFTRLQIH